MGPTLLDGSNVATLFHACKLIVNLFYELVVFADKADLGHGVFVGVEVVDDIL